MSDEETFGWRDAEEIAWRLAEKLPDTDPLSIRFTDLSEWVQGLPGFVGEPSECNEAVLEAIQMAWYEEASEG